MKRLLIIAIVVLNCLMLIQAALLRAERPSASASSPTTRY